MKHLIFLAIILFILGSCTKKVDSNTTQLHVSFEVDEQNNVSHYVAQTSIDGKTFTDKGIAFADNSKARTYNLYVQTQYSKHIYVRIMAVDFNGDTDYSPISWVNP